MFYCIQKNDWFHQDTVTTLDSTSSAAHRRKSRDRRLPSASSPSPPPRIFSEEIAETLRPHLLSPKRMRALEYSLEIESDSSKAVMYIHPSPRRRPQFTTWDVNAPEFVPCGSQSVGGRGSWSSTPYTVNDKEMDHVACVENLCEARRRKSRDRRRPSVSSPLPPISCEDLAETPRPHLLSPKPVWAFEYPLEKEPDSTKAVMYVHPPLRPRPEFTTLDVNAPEFVPGGSQIDSGGGSWSATPRSDSDEEVDHVACVEHLCVPRRRKTRDQRCPSVSSPSPPPPSPPPPPPPPPSISCEELVETLRPHLLSPNRMWALGYPLEIESDSSKAVVYIHPPPRPRPQFTTWDVNAPEFVPGGSQSDSGRGSWGSTPRSDSDEEVDHVACVEHLCVRCNKTFKITFEGEYVLEDPCVYHWGRMSENRYLCCNTPYGSSGCVVGRYHVWNGTRPGMNGPMEGYVRARTPRGGVYAIDTEMCYTTAGLELTSIAVISSDGRLVYRSLVKPSSPVLDLNTRFSGIRPRDLARATKTLREVQNDLLGFIGTDTILIGHALDNDLRALKLLHFTVVDTCALYPHVRGYPLRRSLRTLTEELLGRSVQRGSSGHSPLEDARAALDLVLLKVQEERAARSRIVH